MLRKMKRKEREAVCSRWNMGFSRVEISKDTDKQVRYPFKGEHRLEERGFSGILSMVHGKSKFFLP